MLTKLLRIAEVAKKKPMEKFTSLAHLINEPMLEFCHYQLSGNKALGVDGVTKVEYEAELQDNIKSLVGRLKKHTYRPQPVRRAYIPKPGTSSFKIEAIKKYNRGKLSNRTVSCINSLSLDI
jgi:retron-type reverse transcriptase